MISVRSKPTSPTSLRGEMYRAGIKTSQSAVIVRVNDFSCEVNLQVGRHCEGITI